jgi:hypothetical protein
MLTEDRERSKGRLPNLEMNQLEFPARPHCPQGDSNKRQIPQGYRKEPKVALQISMHVVPFPLTSTLASNC